ncbi:MAG: hypothetical protein J0L55_06470 [Caulobacterales bacterium]|nr:hypothetical protein [Caulobacterales bacterium]MCA0371252.1 hypothetical protein [Pseudomonadota bacterium]
MKIQKLVSNNDSNLIETAQLDAQIIISNYLYQALKNKNIFEENGFSVSLQKTILKGIDEQNI